MTNKPHGTLYVGVTSDLIKRAHEHRHEMMDGFTKKYRCKNLVYYELLGNMGFAITREKQLKAGSRKKKIALIEAMNPEWHDLYGSIIG